MIQSWVDELKKHGPTNIILAIAGNKCDLEKQREVQTAGKMRNMNDLQSTLSC